MNVQKICPGIDVQNQKNMNPSFKRLISVKFLRNFSPELHREDLEVIRILKSDEWCKFFNEYDCTAELSRDFGSWKSNNFDFMSDLEDVTMSVVLRCKKLIASDSERLEKAAMKEKKPLGLRIRNWFKKDRTPKYIGDEQTIRIEALNQNINWQLSNLTKRQFVEKFDRLAAYSEKIKKEEIETARLKRMAEKLDKESNRQKTLQEEARNEIAEFFKKTGSHYE